MDILNDENEEHFELILVITILSNLNFNQSYENNNSNQLFLKGYFKRKKDWNCN